jgi:hypothetical protein
MKLSIWLFSILSLALIILCSNTLRTSNLILESSNSVDFRSFPADRALRERISNKVKEIATPEELRKEVKPIFIANNINSAILAINLIGHQPFLWVYRNSKEKNINLLATKSDEKCFKNYNILLNSWKDTLFVFGPLEVCIDSSIFDGNILSFEEVSDSVGLNLQQKTGQKVKRHF